MIQIRDCDDRVVKFVQKLHYDGAFPNDITFQDVLTWGYWDSSTDEVFLSGKLTARWKVPQ